MIVFVDKVKLIKEVKQKTKTINCLEHKEKQIEEIRQRLLNSNIDFSKFGWVGPAAEIIGITYPKVCQWMRKNMLEFYNTKCFQRKHK